MLLRAWSSHAACDAKIRARWLPGGWLCRCVAHTMMTMSHRSVLAEGRSSIVLAWSPGRVLKWLRPGVDAAMLEREARLTQEARALGLPVPKVFEMRTWQARPGLVMERLDGMSMLQRLSHAPRRALADARRLGTVHARVHAVRAPAAFPGLR